MCYSDDKGSRELPKGNIFSGSKEPQKGTDMTVVRFASYLNNEKQYESLSIAKYEEWSGLSYSFKTKQIENLAIV